MLEQKLAPKQLEFLANANAKWNIAHGSVSCGKTVGSLFRFMYDVDVCPDSDIYMVGHSSETIYRNAVRLLLENPEFGIYRPFCVWQPGKRVLKYKDKNITCLGAKDEGAVGAFQGLTMSLCYSDEITLYPDSVIDMIDSRLRKQHSRAIATCNPKHPEHKIKQWIDKADAGDKNYYHLHYTLDDNPFVPQEYKERIRDSTSGVFYKRNYLGLWCLAEGAIFDFFDRSVHVVRQPPTAAEYWIAGIDYGISNAFACVLIGVSTGRYTQTGRRWWVEKEYYWDCKKTGRQKINSEFATDIQNFLEPYSLRQIYIDPSALAMKLELQRRGLHVVEANNDVLNGIEMMITEMGKGNLTICSECTNLIREIENYVWDDKKAKMGDDAPVKKGDHAVDALRYCIASHKINDYQPYKDSHNPDDYRQGRFDPGRRRF